MNHYLMKYKGTYRILPELDVTTHDIPRDKDVIFIFEIIDDVTFFRIIRKIEFMKYYDLEHYTNDKYVKQIYERIDGVFEKR